MFYIINNNNNATIEYVRATLRKRARNRILLYCESANDKKLNAWLIENYNISLKALCLKLINKLIFMQTSTKEIIIKFVDKESDSLARLITYGNGKSPTSSILRDIFYPKN